METWTCPNCGQTYQLPPPTSFENIAGGEMAKAIHQREHELWDEFWGRDHYIVPDTATEAAYHLTPERTPFQRLTET